VIVELRADSPVPPFEQLRQQIAHAVTTGSLRPGDQLPTVRQLAADLSIAAGTVQRAYQTLVEQGVLEARGRRGTRVAASPARDSGDDHAFQLDVLATAFVAQANRLIATEAQVLLAVRRAWNDVQRVT
jgi:DNA-binding transcriptional regulator YhcF (GntR family)